MYVCSLCGYSIPMSTQTCPHCHVFYHSGDLECLEKITRLEFQKRLARMYRNWVRCDIARPVYMSVSRVGNYTIRRIKLNNETVIETRIRERRGT
jgi:hypothetical protein